jgi:hypothetical protein
MLALPLTISAKTLESGNSVSMRMRCGFRALRSPSPQPSPQRRGRIIASRLASRESCELSSADRSRYCLSRRAAHSPQVLCSLPQSRRDCVLQPRVASNELPWVNCPRRRQPQRGCGLRSPVNRRNPVGVGRAWVPFPRVARCSQPWALRRNPVGIRSPDSSSCGKHSAQRERAGVRGNGPYVNPRRQMTTRSGQS